MTAAETMQPPLTGINSSHSQASPQQLRRLFVKIFHSMPDVFTSSEFRAKLLATGPEHGIAKEELSGSTMRHIILGFLRLTSNQNGMKGKKWRKAVKEDFFNTKSKEQEGQLLSKCIAYAKEKGLRVLGPIQEWKEL